MKECRKCGDVLEDTDFNVTRRNKDGLASYCKSCCKDWREANRHITKKKKREYHSRAEIKERCVQYKKKYYQENKERLTLQMRDYYECNRDVYLFNKARERAARDGIDFDLEVSDIQIPRYCPYLSIPLTLCLGKGQLETNASLDRIDSTKGYIKGNVQVISRKANTMKNNANIHELITFARSVLELHGESDDY